VTLRLHDTLKEGKEEFTPLDAGQVRMYTCGPTVWNYPHIGNYRAFLVYDLLRRHLRVSGYEVRQVMNITDVDDRIIEQAAARNYAGVITSIADFDVLKKPIAQVVAKKIPLITINSGTTAQSEQLGAIMHVGQPEYDAGKAAGVRAKAAGAVSLALWIGVVAFGRKVGFTLH